MTKEEFIKITAAYKEGVIFGRESSDKHKEFYKGKLAAIDDIADFIESHNASQGLDEASEKYSESETCYANDSHLQKQTTKLAFKAGAKWDMEQGVSKEGEVFDNNEFIKFPDGTFIDLDPAQKLEPAFKLKDGDKVIVQIRKKEL